MKIKRKILATFFLLTNILIYGQLSDFNLDLKKTDETCKSNGSITITTENITAGATVLFSVFKLPEITTPITITASNTINGLIAGNYRIVATQSLENLSNSQTKEITILNNNIPVTFQIQTSNNICGNDGKITIKIISGVVKSFEIISGPEIRPKQISNVFENLSPGQYSLRITDVCDNGITQAITVFKKNANVDLAPIVDKRIIDCNTVEVSHLIKRDNLSEIPFPLQLEFTILPPNGNPIIISSTLSESVGSDVVIKQIIPFYNNLPYSYNIKILDRCGNEYIYNSNKINLSSYPTITYSLQSNNLYTITITHIIEAQLVLAPIEYPYPIPKDLTGLINKNNNQLILKDMPYGEYKFNLNDLCGNVLTLVSLLPKPEFIPIPITIKEGCDSNSGSIYIDIESKKFVSARFLNAPTTYTSSFSSNISTYITSNKKALIINNLPIGNYVIEFEDATKIKEKVSFTIQGYKSNSKVNIFRNCGVFDFELIHNSNEKGLPSPTFWFQKYDENLKQWTHPITGEIYNINETLSNKNAQSISIGKNFNFTVYGKFRVLKNFTTFKFSNDENYYGNCIDILEEFEVAESVKINSIYVYSCASDKNDIIIDAVGAQPLTYRITSKNDIPYNVDNGTNNIFTQLESAYYNFQIEDQCGNILNYPFNINTTIPFQITATAFCENNENSLSLPYFPFLEYNWINKSDPNKILSTSNSLVFPDFQAIRDGGTYTVLVKYSGNSNNCINFSNDYIIPKTTSKPNAGNDLEKLYCGAVNQIDLNTLLDKSIPSTGTWVDLDSNKLSGTILNTRTLPNGEYNFKYVVSGNCKLYDEAKLVIKLKEIPQIIDVSTSPLLCLKNNIPLYATVIPQDVNFSWTGPNNFVSDIQNPIIPKASEINNGTYSLVVEKEGCKSNSKSITANLLESPEFSLKGRCYENQYEIEAVFNNPIQKNGITNYQWTGPDAFISNEAIINNTGITKGIYTLLATLENGCSSEQSIWVKSTFCEFQRGISKNGDTANNSFDLTAFDNISLVKIYNRYGVLVFELPNYKDEWKGQDKSGKMLPEGVYYYNIEFRDEQLPKTGWIYLSLN